MAKIYEMPPHLADLIAAGEVVERPGSVVKELCENSIDAGATSMTVEIKNGGMSLIRVTDNGFGIAAEDAEKAFLRHATSKLRDERGLEAIGTLGFRGEALAAIASVSRIELITKEPDAPFGTRMTLEGGAVTEKEQTGCPDGTTMIVRNLFYNTPARLKYMKNDKAEGSAVTTVMTRIALSHPEISIRYIKDGKEEMHTPGDGRIDSCVYSTLGREFAKSLLKAESEANKIRVSGYVSTPGGSRGNRSWQFFFVNGRFIRSKLLQAALEQAYKNSLFTGRFPVCVLNIDMSLSNVDVNVHPTKMEVRFSNEREVFDAVYWAVRGALDGETKPAELPVSPQTASVIKNGYQEPEKSPGTNAGTSFRAGSASGGFSQGAARSGGFSYSGGTYSAKPREDFFKNLSADTYKTTYTAPTGGFKTSIPASGTVSGRSEVHDDFRAAYQTKMDMPETRPLWTPDAPIEEAKEEKPWRYVGEALTTYLIVEKEGSIFLIDKHAAHERVLFDRLKASAQKPESQLLLTPVVVNIGQEAAGVILENAALLAEFGFEVDDFGSGSIAIRQVPADIDLDDADAFMEEIAENLTSGGRQSIETMRDDVMHTVACKAAIKAGKMSEPASVMDLIDRVMRGEVRYCPHGRPVAMELTKSQLDRSFKRA